MTLFKMWEDAYAKNKLPPEWPIWEDFRTWAINNRYKAEYGYKGEFSPQGCVRAMPGYEEVPIDVFKASDVMAGVDHAKGLDKTAIQIMKNDIAEVFKIPPEILESKSGEYANYLATSFSFASLKKYAEDVGLDTKGLKSKKEIAKLIEEGRQG